MKKYVLFDLDGTLTDSKEGIYNSIEYALAAYGIAVENRSSLRPFLGPPLTESLSRYYGFGREQAREAVEKYREYFDRQGLYENKVYPGIVKMLERLNENGYQLYVATSKPERASRIILEHFGLSQYFVFIGGATLDSSRVHKADVIRYVLETAQITDMDEVLMVGDRENDMIGARENGIDPIGVLYGYGDREELEASGAACLAESPEQVAEAVLSWDK